MEGLAGVKSAAALRVLAPLKVGPFRLVAGQYVAEAANGLGTFYRGPRFALVMDASGKWVAHDGGIWVPAADSAPPRFYSYVGQPVWFDSLEAALADRTAASAGSGGKAEANADATAALLANPSLNPLQLATTGVVASVVVAGIEAHQRSITGADGTRNFPTISGKLVEIDRTTFERSVRWEKP